MEFGKYSSKDRFSLRQVVGMLTLVIVGVAVFANATVTIPNTFTSGTTAQASEVNANFTSLTNAIPAVKTTALSSQFAVSNYPTATPALTLSVTIPSAGQGKLTAPGIMCIKNHYVAEKMISS